MCARTLPFGRREFSSSLQNFQSPGREDVTPGEKEINSSSRVLFRFILLAMLLERIRIFPNDFLFVLLDVFCCLESVSGRMGIGYGEEEKVLDVGVSNGFLKGTSVYEFGIAIKYKIHFINTTFNMTS